MTGPQDGRSPGVTSPGSAQISTNHGAAIAPDRTSHHRPDSGQRGSILRLTGDPEYDAAELLERIGPDGVDRLVRATVALLEPMRRLRRPEPTPAPGGSEPSPAPARTGGDAGAQQGHAPTADAGPAPSEVRAAMIPAPPGTFAIYNGLPYKGATETTDREVPVVALDLDLGALVLTPGGDLIPAANFRYRPGYKFRAVVTPDTDPVVAVERTDGPVAIGTDHGLDEAHGWAYRASGEVSPILDSEGTPWIIHASEWEPWKPSARDLGAA